MVAGQRGDAGFRRGGASDETAQPWTFHRPTATTPPMVLATGTRTARDLLDDVDVRGRPWPPGADAGRRTVVHRGISSRALRMCREVERDLLHAGGESPPLVLAGWSLGGGSVICLAAHLASLGVPIRSTSSAPRIRAPPLSWHAEEAARRSARGGTPPPATRSFSSTHLPARRAARGPVRRGGNPTRTTTWVATTAACCPGGRRRLFARRLRNFLPTSGGNPVADGRRRLVYACGQAGFRGDNFRVLDGTDYFFRWSRR